MGENKINKLSNRVTQKSQKYPKTVAFLFDSLNNLFNSFLQRLFQKNIFQDLIEEKKLSNTTVSPYTARFVTILFLTLKRHYVQLILGDKGQ